MADNQLPWNRTEMLGLAGVDNDSIVRGELTIAYEMFESIIEGMANQCATNTSLVSDRTIFGNERLLGVTSEVDAELAVQYNRQIEFLIAVVSKRCFEVGTLYGSIHGSVLEVSGE